MAACGGLSQPFRSEQQRCLRPLLNPGGDQRDAQNQPEQNRGPGGAHGDGQDAEQDAGPQADLCSSVGLTMPASRSAASPVIPLKMRSAPKSTAASQRASSGQIKIARPMAFSVCGVS